MQCYVIIIDWLVNTTHLINAHCLSVRAGVIFMRTVTDVKSILMPAQLVRLAWGYSPLLCVDAKISKTGMSQK